MTRNNAPDGTRQLIKLAKGSGVPKDSLKRFLAAGYVPQPKQLDFHAAARLADTDEELEDIGYGGARGGGKTHCGFAQIAIDDCHRWDNLSVLFLREKAGSAKESMQKLCNKILFKVPHRPTQSIIHFPNKSTIKIGHFQYEKDINQYLSLEYDVIFIEQLEQLSQSKIEEIKTVNRTSLDGVKPRLYATFNPGGLSHTYLKKKFIEPWRNGKETDTRFIQATVRDNRKVDKFYIGKLEKLTGWKRKAWLDGDWDIFAGQYFSTFSYDDHVIEPNKLPNPIPDTWTVWCSLDYGFTHFTVCHLLAEFDGTVYFIDEHSARKTTVPVHAEAIKAMLSRHGVEFHQLANFSAGTDVFAQRGAASGETIADQYEKEGIRLTPANTDRINGAARFLELLGDKEKGIEPRLKISTRCPMLIEQLPAMQHNPKKPEDVLKMNADDHGTGGDDAYDSGRYGVMTDNSLGILV